MSGSSSSTSLGALYDLIDAAESTEILEVDRPSVVPPPRKWFRR